MTPLTAIVIADAPGADARVVGLSLAERARRVAVRAGASAVLVARSRAELPAWWRANPSERVLVIRATDQLVHTPLVSGLVATDRALAIAVAPRDAAASDCAAGSYAGAMIACGAAASRLVAALADGADDRALAATALADGADAIPHGAIARHPATTPDQRRAAARLLYRIIHKPQDNAITRYLYRPLSFPLTRLLVHTAITPNQISYCTAVLIAIGCWLTARGPVDSAILGTAIVLAASYVDCCDGEVARLKLQTSRFGAWLDTVVDELSQVAYMIALGLHCAHSFGVFGDLGPHDRWLYAIAIGAVTYTIAIYCVYWNIVVLIGSANSQDYVGKFEITDGDAPGTARLRPVAAQAIAVRPDMHPALKFAATYAPYLVRKDLVSWGVLVLAVVHLTELAFGLLVAGGVLTAAIVAIDHVRVRAQLFEIRRRDRVFVR